MNITLVILVAEVAVVLLVIVGFLLYLRWKQKRVQTAEIEKLLDNVSSQEEERKSQLLSYFIDSHAMDNEAAKEASDFMVEAEKQFIQQFLKQQMEQTPVTNFYQNLCELLDQYLYFIPTIETGKTTTKEKEK
ncbi:MAG: hypothetical protein ACKE51_01440 [Methylococcaceae bacterium]